MIVLAIGDMVIAAASIDHLRRYITFLHPAMQKSKETS
jgi:hypothetical protein